MKATPEQVAALMASGWVDSNLRACIPNRVAEGWPLECTFHRRVWGERGCERAAGAADVVMALALDEEAIRAKVDAGWEAAWARAEQVWIDSMVAMRARMEAAERKGSDESTSPGD
jgi:hypothetical protein